MASRLQTWRRIRMAGERLQLAEDHLIVASLQLAHSLFQIAPQLPPDRP